MRRIGLAALLVVLAATSRAVAAERVLALDPAASTVQFTLGATLHTVHGSIGVKGGELRFDLATGRASGRIVLDATRAETGNAKRDRKMHADVLESARFAEIVFEPQELRDFPMPLAAGKGQLVGQVTLKGRQHPLTLAVEIETVGDRLEATATCRVPYVAWGLEDPSAFVLRVEKEVAVTVRAIFKPSAPSAPAS